MPLPQKLIDTLNEEHAGAFHDKLLQRCKDLVQLSRGLMCQYYDRWDRYDMAYRGESFRDAADIKAGQRKEPEKFVVPITYSQVETFVAFCYQVYTQRPTFFELDGSGGEDAKAAGFAQSVLEYNLEHNNWKGEKLQQFLRNVGRFGLGVIKSGWDVKTQQMEQDVPMEIPGWPAELPPPTMKQMVDVPVYQGNVLQVVSPYRFFPDPRLPITRFHEGEFCASEDDYSRITLQTMEKYGAVAGVKHIQKFGNDMLLDGTRRTSWLTDNVSAVTSRASATDDNDFVVVTEIQIELVPKDWMLDDGTKLGESDRSEKYLIWYANDSRIIRITPLGYMHNRFTYDVSQYNNDNLRYLNDGLCGMIEQMQSVHNWLINSHITSVRKVISNMLVVDPKGVEMSDLQNRNPVIRLKPTVQGSGVDRWIRQLNVNDVTQNHVNDASVIEGFAKQTSGISENLLGQYSSGRRSALEARSVNSNAAARLLLVANSIWFTAILPLGRKMLSNCRDGMDVEQLVRIVGMTNVMSNPEGVSQFLTVDKTKLVGNYDFLVFDGTMATARGATAMQLQELLTALIANPQLPLLFNIDPRKLMNEILTLNNIRNVDRFQFDPNQAQQLAQMVGGVGNQAASAPAQIGSGPVA